MNAKNPSIPIENADQISPSPVDLPDGIVRQTTVFLVNVLGLNEYFESMGDAAGKDMLHRFHNISSRLIAESGGVIAKSVGDSVWAHFTDARKSLHAAVALQKKFDTLNRERFSRDERIVIRIGIHYGDVIAEKDDLHGHAAKQIREILPRLDAGRVCITREVFELVGNDPPVPLEPMDIKGDAFPKGLRLYEAVWNEIPTAAPEVSSPTTLYVRPLWQMAESEFRGAWEELISERPSARRHPPLPRKRVLADRSVVFATGGVPRSINKARNVLAFINNRPAAGRMPLVPIQIIVDAGMYFTLDGAVSLESDIAWSEMAPGEIYITPAAYSRLRDTENLNFEPHSSGKFYRFIDKKRRAPTSPVSFPFGAAMFQGGGPPCFYCGLRRHPSIRCPSKMLGGRRNALESMGYLSPENLSKLFFGYLMGVRGEHSKIQPANVSVSYDMVAEGALELQYIHQLRFFALLWGGEWESWDKITNSRSGGAGRKGGEAWLAFDCIRSSNHIQAEKILDKALEKAPHDFRIYCIMGYLHIEQDKPARAADDFAQALCFARTNPQRIFIHFLLFRLCCLGGRLIDAEKHLDEIFGIDSKCLDAVYHSAVFSFRGGDNARGMEKLLGLIREDRKYFIRALVAPELAQFHRAIARSLGRLYEDTREIAEEGMQIAETEIDRLKNVLGEEERFVGEMTSLWKKTQRLYATKSYFGALDAGRTAAVIISEVQREIGRRQEYFYQLLSELDERSLGIIDDVKTLPDAGMAGTLDGELKSIRGEIDAVRKDLRLERGGVFETASAKSSEISEKLKKAKAKLELLKNLRTARDFFITFSRISMIFQPINLLIGVILIPAIVRYLSPDMMGGNIISEHFRFCQVGATIVGGAAGFIYAIVKGLDHAEIE